MLFPHEHMFWGLLIVLRLQNLMPLAHACLPALIQDLHFKHQKEHFRVSEEEQRPS